MSSAADSDERRSGVERRDDPPHGRVVYSDGPIIRILQVLSALTAVIAAIALVLTVTSQSEQIQRLQRQRASSRFDSCELLRGIVLLATPPGQSAKAHAFIATTPLRNCRAYAAKP